MPVSFPFFLDLPEPEPESAVYLGNFSPPDGTLITAYTPVLFDVTSLLPLAFLHIGVAIAGAGLDETVWRSGTFTPYYSARSARSAIANGYRYSVLRRDGWPRVKGAENRITVYLDAVDEEGVFGVGAAP